MTAPLAVHDSTDRSAAARAGRAVQAAAAVVLLCIVVARAFVSELPFRIPLIDLASIQSARPETLPVVARADRTELARVTFSCLLLADAALWLAGAALAGQLAVRGGKLAAPMAVFLALSLASALYAPDKRSALDVWLEQGAMMLGCLLAVQCLAERSGLVLLAAVLAATGGALAAQAIHQVLVEIPQTVAYFKAYGWQSSLVGEGTQQAFEARLRATTPTGFFGLSNLLASMLIICLPAAAGLCVAMLRRALSVKRAGQANPNRGETALAAGLMVAATAAIAAALVLTRSRGGIVAAAVAVVAWACVARWRERLARRWRLAIAVAAAVFLAVCVAVVGYGLARDRLPGKSMTFRWYYWTAAAEMVKDRPVLGVGGGNFGPAYLAYRRPGAEEAVKSPHNSIVEAVSEYGIPGGLAYLAAVAFVLVGMCRPATGAPTLAAQPVGPRLRPWLIAGALAVSVAATRGVFSEAGADSALFVLNGIAPALLLAVLTLAAVWGGAALGDDVPIDAIRLPLACGVAGMFLHSMVEFNLSMAGTATAFWVAGGCCLGAGGAAKKDISRLRWVLLAGAMATAITAIIIFWWPVYHRTMLSDAAMHAAARGGAGAAGFAEQAAEADPLDGQSAADAARAILASCGGDDWNVAKPRLLDALRWAKEAIRRDPSYYAHHRLTADIAWLLADRDSFTYAWDRLPAPPAQPIGRPSAFDLAAAAKAAYLDGRYPEAVERLKAAIKEDPNSASLNGYLGDAEWQAGRPDRAAVAWRRAVQLAPRGAMVDQALAEMASAVHLNPMDHRLRMAAAEMYAKVGEAKGCLLQVEAAERIDAALLPDSLLHFNQRERGEIAMLKARATAWWVESRPSG